jgi:hypothetical protein
MIYLSCHIWNENNQLYKTLGKDTPSKVSPPTISTSLISSYHTAINWDRESNLTNTLKERNNVCLLSFVIHCIFSMLFISIGYFTLLYFSYFMTYSQSVCMYVWRLLPESCGLVSVGRPLWWEAGSAVCSAITQWSKLHRTRNHNLLSHLWLPQPGGQGSPTYIPPGTGWPSYSPGHWVPFTSPLTTCRDTAELF